MRLIYNRREIEESLAKTKERTFSSLIKNSAKNSEPNLFKKARTVLLCLRANVLAQERRSIYFIRYKLPFFEDPL